MDLRRNRPTEAEDCEKGPFFFLLSIGVHLVEVYIVLFCQLGVYTAAVPSFVPS